MTQELSSAATTLRTHASSWRNVLQQTQLLEIPLPGDGRSAKQLAIQALANIELAVSQTRAMSNGKSPSDDRHYVMQDEHIDTEGSQQASTLSYRLADQSGNLADLAERAGRSNQVGAIQRSLDAVIADNGERLTIISAGYKELTKNEGEES